MSLGPSNPFSPWLVPPSVIDLEEEMARAYAVPEPTLAPVPAAAPPSDAPVVDLPATEDAPVRQTARVEAPPRELDDNDQSNIDKWLEFKRAEYEQGGMSPEKIEKAQEFNRKRFNDFLKRRSGPGPGVARIAQATGPVGTINQIGQGDPFASTAELPYGALDLSPDEAAQIEIDSPGGAFGDMQPDADPQSFPSPSAPGFEPGDYSSAAADGVAAGVDAVTGALRYEPPTPPDMRTPMMPDDYKSPEEMGAEWSNLSIEEQEAKRGDIEGGREKMRLDAKHAIETQALWDAEKNAREVRRAIKSADEKAAELDKEAAAIANEKIDPLKNISTSQKVLGVLAAFIGGFGMNKTGRNVGLEQVDAMIADEVNAQTANLGNRKAMLGARQNAVADQLARGKDLYQAQETVRLAAYDQLVRKLETDVQQYDPRGTRALRMMDTINAIRAKRADMLGKYRKDELDRAEKLLKEQREIARLNEEMRRNRAQEKLESWRIGESARAAKAREQHERDALALEGKKIEATAGKDAAAQLLERGIGGMVTLTGEVDENGVPKTGYTPMKNADGSTFVAPTKEEAILFRKKKAAADTITSLMDETIRMVKEHGFEPDFLQSKAWQEMKANWSTIMVKQKDFQDLGAITESDAKLITGLMGAKDPTQLRSPLAGMEKAFDNTVNQFNNDLHSIGYTGTAYAPVKSWTLPGAQPTEEDVQFKNSLKKKGAEIDVERLEADMARGLTTTQAANLQIQERLRDPDNGAPTDVERVARSLVQKMTDKTLPKKERDEARAKLEAGAEKGHSQQIRDAYTAALSGALIADLDAGTDAPAQASTAPALDAKEMLPLLEADATDTKLPPEERERARARLEAGAANGPTPEIRAAYQAALNRAVTPKPKKAAK
jgi:hypothetical protein